MSKVICPKPTPRKPGPERPLPGVNGDDRCDYEGCNNKAIALLIMPDGVPYAEPMNTCAKHMKDMELWGMVDATN